MHAMAAADTRREPGPDASRRAFRHGRGVLERRESLLDALKTKGFDIQLLHHAGAILERDLPEAARELETALCGLSVPVVELVRSGGGETALTQRTRRTLADLGWTKHRFEIVRTIDGREAESVSHEVDHVRRLPQGVVALEIEWNNKDPFFDRDLENFKRLHADGAISVGVIVTRGATLQAELPGLVLRFARSRGIRSLHDLVPYDYAPTERQRQAIAKQTERRGAFEEGWAHAFVSDKYGSATTHWSKLMDRVARGVGNPCPLLLIGLPASIVDIESRDEE